MSNDDRFLEADGMPRDCSVNCDQLQTVPKKRIGFPITSLPSAKMADAGRAVGFALGI